MSITVEQILEWREAAKRLAAVTYTAGPHIEAALDRSHVDAVEDASEFLSALLDEVETMRTYFRWLAANPNDGHDVHEMAMDVLNGTYAFRHVVALNSESQP